MFDKGLKGIWDRIYLGITSDFVDNIIRPLMYGTNKNKFDATTDISKVSVVMTCFKVVSNGFSRIPIRILNSNDKSNKNLVDDYRYDLLYYSPDGNITGQAFWLAVEYNRLMRGNSYVHIHWGTNGRATKLELIPSSKVKGYKYSSEGKLLYILYGAEKGKFDVIKNDDMLHFKMDSVDGVMGLNPIEAIRLQVSKTWKRDTTEDTYFENNAFSPAYIKSTIPDGNTQQKAWRESMEKFDLNQTGVSNSGKWVKLPPYSEIQQLELTSVDEKFINSSKFDAARIAGYFGIPPYMVGVYEYSKYSNLEHEQQNFKSALSNTIFMYKREIENKLFSRKELKEGLYIDFDSNVLIVMDTTTKLNYYKTMNELGVMTASQIADKEGLPIPEELNKLEKETKNE